MQCDAVEPHCGAQVVSLDRGGGAGGGVPPLTVLTCPALTVSYRVTSFAMTFTVTSGASCRHRRAGRHRSMTTRYRGWGWVLTSSVGGVGGMSWVCGVWW